MGLKTYVYVSLAVWCMVYFVENDISCTKTGVKCQEEKWWNWNSKREKTQNGGNVNFPKISNSFYAYCLVV